MTLGERDRLAVLRQVETGRLMVDHEALRGRLTRAGLWRVKAQPRRRREVVVRQRLDGVVELTALDH